MDKLLKPRNLAIMGVAITAAMFYPRAPNIFETPGTKNIGDRFSAAGAKDTHTPGVATRRGDSNHVEPNQVKDSGTKPVKLPTHATRTEH